MIRITHRHCATIVELDPAYGSLSEERLEEIAEVLLAEAWNADPPRIVLDLSHTGFVGTAFIELLVRLWKRLAERGGWLALCGVRPFCVEVLKVSCLDTLWPIYDDQAQALESLETEAGPAKL